MSCRCSRTEMCQNSLTSDARYVKVGNLQNSFCAIPKLVQDGEPLQTTESPELPDWVKSGKKDYDDFVVPSITYWIENHKLHSKKPDIEILESDVDTIGKILKCKFGSPDAVVQVLSGFQVEVTESLVEQILRRFCFDWIQALGSFRWAKSQNGFYCSPHLYDLMVDTLGKARKFDVMWDFVEEMKQLDGYITMNTMSKVIRRLAKAGKHVEAVEVFRGLERFGLHQDVSGMNLLMDALIKDRGVEHAENVYHEFKHDVLPDQHTFNILIHGWCKFRKMDKAKTYIEEMQLHGFNPDVVTYTCFIEMYCEEKDFRKVDTTLHDMQQKGLCPTVVTYTIMMKAFGKAKEISRVLDTYEKVKQRGCIPDNSFYSTLIVILSKMGRLKDAQEVFEDMAKQGITPDVVTYNSMISATVQHSKEEDALLLLKKMEECELKPDLGTYIPLLKMCCTLKRMKVLSFLLSHMFKNNVSLDLGTYALLVSRLSVNGRIERACSLFEESVERGFLPTNSMYKKLVDLLQKNGMDKEKVRIEELMQRAKLQESLDSSRTDIQAIE